MERIIELEVQPDFIERLANARPVQAISELVWNSFDADATDVRVEFDRDAADLLQAVRVADDGYGIPYDDAPNFFMKLGGSWKRERKRSPHENRALHGEEGKGRFRALALGRVVDWQVTVPESDAPEAPLIRYSITIIRDRPRQATISDPSPAPESARRGVEVVVSELFKQWQLEDNEEARNELTATVALYLTDYRHVSLSFGGVRLDAAAEIARRDQFHLSPIAVNGSPWVQLDVIEWRTERDRALHLCNEHGFPLCRLAPEIIAPGFSFAAYLKSPYIGQLNEDNLLDLAEMVPPLNVAVDEARAKLREHFRSRAAEKVKDLVQVWKSEHVYPYEEDPRTPVEQVQRQVFDVVAVSVASALPEIQSGEQRTRRFQFRVLRQALERSPEDLQLIINEVLQLPQKKREDLAQLLQKTSLVKIISAAKLVADRLEFLDALEAMLFQLQNKAVFKERKQLHRILAVNTWLFGEEFALTVSDRSLTEVLRKHRDACKMTNMLVDDEPVLRPEGSAGARRRGIVDLVLSRRVPTPYASQLDHLVIELKAPKKLLAAEDTQQLRSYAYAVADDERFKGIQTTWRFWLVGNDLTPYVEGELDNGLPAGVLQRTADGAITLSVRRWSELIHEARARLEFVQKELNYEVNRDDALERFRETYAHLLGADAAPTTGAVEHDEVEDDESPDGEVTT
jgi:histidine kinase/DNA gyrase B/HSP90-like ATPase